jgi:hypothetical protein
MTIFDENKKQVERREEERPIPERKEPVQPPQRAEPTPQEPSPQPRQNPTAQQQQQDLEMPKPSRPVLPAPVSSLVRPPMVEKREPERVQPSMPAPSRPPLPAPVSSLAPAPKIRDTVPPTRNDNASRPIQEDRQRRPVATVGAPNQALLVESEIRAKLMTLEQEMDELRDDFADDEAGSGGGGSGVWSGWYWYAGVETNRGFTGLRMYFGCDLTTGIVDFTDDPSEFDLTRWEFRRVADRTGDSESNYVYTLSGRTCGDIIFRIT